MDKIFDKQKLGENEEASSSSSRSNSDIEKEVTQHWKHKDQQLEQKDISNSNEDQENEVIEEFSKFITRRKIF